MQPLVSVIIPVKDRVELLAETLASVRTQSEPHWEALLVDDGSSAASLASLSALVAGDPRVRLLARGGDRPGANACRNQGLAASRGRYVLFLDSDDLLEPECLEQRVAVLEGQPRLGFGVWAGRVFLRVPGDSAFYWSTLEEGGDDLMRFLRVDVPWQTSGPLWRREALDRVGPWDEALPSWQDWDFHVRALCAGIAYRKLPTADYWIRRGHESRVSLDSRRAVLVARGRMLVKTIDLLRDKRLLEAEHRHAVAGMFWLFARLCAAYGGSFRSAAALWRTCHQQGLISRPRYWQGAALLALGRARARLGRQGWIARTWRDYRHIDRSEHCSARAAYQAAEDAKPVRLRLETATA